MTSPAAPSDRSDREALARSTAQAIGLPGGFYGPANFELEHERIFARRWVPVAVGAEVPEPGDMKPVEIAGWHVLVVRTRAGRVKCFHNICRHRGMKLVAEPCRRKRAIQCPWHSWIYDLDGALSATPMIAGDDAHRHEAFDNSTLGLVEIRSARWLDYVSVNIDGQARPFEDWLAPLAGFFAGFDLSGLAHGTTIDTPFEGNWKFVVEGAMENYHVPFCHPQLSTGEKQGDWRHEVLGDCAISMHYAPEAFRKLGEGGSIVRQNSLPRCPRSPPDLGGRQYLITIFPTGIFFINANHVGLNFLLPVAHDRTRYVRHLYLFGDGATSPVHREQREAVFDSWRTIGEQDIALVRNVQEMARVRDAAGIRTRFSPYWERSVHNFQKLYAGAIG